MEKTEVTESVENCGLGQRWKLMADSFLCVCVYSTEFLKCLSVSLILGAKAEENEPLPSQGHCLLSLI